MEGDSNMYDNHRIGKYIVSFDYCAQSWRVWENGEALMYVKSEQAGIKLAQDLHNPECCKSCNYSNTNGQCRLPACNQTS